MSGHSKWSTIKHKKGANDAKRGKILTKHAKILSVVGRNDPNPDTNATLRTAIANAKAENVPNENIERTLKKLSGEGKDGAIYTEQIYGINYNKKTAFWFTKDLALQEFPL